jgi:enoyl-CoA hydratase/carnithine racemase
LEFNRRDALEAAGDTYEEEPIAFDWLSLTSHARVGVISAQGNHFTAGIDLEFLMAIKSELAHLPEGRRQERLREFIVGL